MNAMVNAAGNELSDKFADFSAGWLKDDTDDNSVYKKNSKKRLSAVKNESSFANRNVSSIVSKIRDDGAAFSSDDTIDNKQSQQKSPSEAPKKIQLETAVTFADVCDEDVVTLSSHVNKVAKTVSPEEKKTEPPKPSFFAVCDQPVEMEVSEDTMTSAESVQKKISKKNTALISIIAVSMFAVLGYMSYQFKAQSDEMKQTLQMYKQAVHAEKSSQGKVLSVLPVPVKDETISILKKTATAIITEKQNTDIDAVALIDIAEKKSKTNAKLTTVAANKKSAVKPLPLEKASVRTYAVAEKLIMFTVNLASFSDKAKAADQLAVFKSLGVSAVIEPAEVNNKTIYRLCVEGFSSREEASLFISRLNRKYTDNAWVRQI